MTTELFALGLMSGTSLDGLDICYAKFWRENSVWNFDILEAETIPYNEIWRTKLENAFICTAESLAELNTEYGFYLGEKANEFCTKYTINRLDLIASHGHTIFHNPAKKYTMQIGDGRAIKIHTNLPTIYDFRVLDVLFGGNGAPLVPIGDKLLFSKYEACLNLGGFSNISFTKEHKRIAFDICPVNIVLNELAQKLGKEFDKDGELARTSTADEKLFHKLNSIDFYKLQHPKSLGKEWVEEQIKPLLTNINPQIAIATFTEHCAEQIANVLNENSLKNVLITGGGAYNSYLIERIKQLTTTEIILPNSTVINFKEALIFAFMGVLNKVGEPNILSSATGSLHDHCSGIWA